MAALYWRIIFFIIMNVVTFGVGKNTILCSMVYLIFNLSLGGMIGLCENNSFVISVVSAIILYFFVLITRKIVNMTGGIVSIRIRTGTKELNLKALRDTGNELRDPVSGENVLIVGAKEASELSGLSLRQIKEPIQTMLSSPKTGMQLIPFRTVDQSGKMMLAMRYPDVWISGEKRSTIVAFAPNDFGTVRYQALAGGLY